MSVSSLEGSPVPTDLPTKYQKLATEYAKIRAQVGVLKKAVVDEQARSTDLKETLRIKDQNLRKAEQELDSLGFRNQQLTKRVTILQDELDAIQQNHSKKGKIKNLGSETSNSVIIEELQNKITENAHLMSLLQEQNETYEKEKFKLTQEHEMYEHELKECKKVISAIENVKLAKAENENKLLLVKVNAKEEELKKLYNELKMFKSGSTVPNSISNHVELRDKFSNLLQSLPVIELLTTLRSFFHNFELRYKKFHPNLNVQKFSECIQKYQSNLYEFIDGYSLYSVNANSNEGFLQRSSQLSEDINNHIINSEELSVFISLSENEEINKIFRDIVLSFKKEWMQFGSTLKMCLSPNISPIESEDCVTRVADIFRSLRRSCDYFLSALTDQFKSRQEQLDREILSTLSRTSVLSGAIFKKINENVDLLSQVVQYRGPTKQQEVTLQPQTGKCCEHWRQEYETLKMTHSKKIKDLEEQISCLSGSTTPRSNNSMVQSPTEGKVESAEITNMFGSLSTPQTSSAENEMQESEMKKYFNSRANTLIADRQLAEGKFTAMKAECEDLQNRLEHSIKSRLVLEASVKHAQDTVNRLQEELAITTSNYEIQLSSMSEHMANMNDKLTSQQEEIEQLSYQLTSKESKKGRTK